MTFVK